MTFAQWLQLWGAIGSSVFLVLMAVLKRRWKVVDQRKTSHKTLRDLAKLYQDAFRKQQAFYAGIAADVKSAYQHKADLPQFFDFTMVHVKDKLEAVPDFLELARKEQSESIDSIVIPEAGNDED